MKWTMWDVATYAKGCWRPVIAGLGANFGTRSQAEAVRSPAWHGWARQLGSMVERSMAEGAVKKGVAVHAVSPVRS